jgi:hypothetical protein
LEEIVDTSAAEQQGIAERSRELAQVSLSHTHTLALALSLALSLSLSLSCCQPRSRRASLKARAAVCVCLLEQALPKMQLSVDQLELLRRADVCSRMRTYASQALRKMQVSVDQLEVHRGAVYVSDQALQKLQDEVRRHARTLESVQQQQSKAASAQLGSPDAAHRGGGSVCGSDVADSAATRLREQLNLLRAEMDAGFIKYISIHTTHLVYVCVTCILMVCVDTYLSDKYIWIVCGTRIVHTSVCVA